MRGPLHGIPVIIKDNIATADRMQTTAGSLALLGSKPPRDSHLARRLREAGAVIIAKTNLSEWANFRSTHSTSGWSGRGGLCRNPYALDRNTSGSSSGTGGATSANLAAIGIGTETDGSIVSRRHLQRPGGHQADGGPGEPDRHRPDLPHPGHGGPDDADRGRRRSAADGDLGYDPEDSGDEGAPRQGAGVDYTTFLKADGLKGIRIGVVREVLMGYSTHADGVAEEAIRALKSLGRRSWTRPISRPSSPRRSARRSTR